MKLVTVAEMLAIEKEADQNGLSYSRMMENAGRGLAEAILGIPFGKPEQEALALVGSGNNGGDALVALAYLALQGWSIRAYLVKRLPTGDTLVERLQRAGGEVTLAEQDHDFRELSAGLERATVVIDGLLGTGIRLPLRESISGVLKAAKTTLAGMDRKPYVVAVDCPSGVDCDSGEAAEECLPADLTVTMAAVKQGLLRLPAYGLLGELQVVDIGLTDEIHTWVDIPHEVADFESVSTRLPARPLDAHKGDFGTALVVAGSLNYTGAALLAGRAAYRIGAGLVTLAVPGPLHAALAGAIPEATWLLLPHEMGVIAVGAADVLMKDLDRPTAILVGPGFGLEDTTRDFIRKLLEGKPASRKNAGRIGFIRAGDNQEGTERQQLPPMVFDADGLKLLSKIEGWAGLAPAPAVLTPHPGEMSVLTGLPVSAIQADRLSTAARFAQEWGHVVVLKGAFTVVAAPDGRTTTIPVASSALARAGTGDVLAGLVVGLIAQGLDAYASAVTGAWIHAQAGLYAAEALGTEACVLAGDVLDAVVEVLADLS
ncbi:MAG: NAD(P)H-hydrate dehydratase [Anaerolineales bacterium]|nr:NAD(P)H-hydrate dehydratase [Anaerolineales bacterium]